MEQKKRGTKLQGVKRIDCSAQHLDSVQLDTYIQPAPGCAWHKRSYIRVNFAKKRLIPCSSAACLEVTNQRGWFAGLRMAENESNTASRVSPDNELWIHGMSCVSLPACNLAY